MKDTVHTATTSIRSESAMITYPISLIVTVTVMTVLLILIMYGAVHLSDDMNIQQVEKTIEAIIYQAETLTAYSDKGTIQTIQISLPDEVICLCFGARPEHIYNDNITVQRNKNITNLIYYQMKNGIQKTTYSKVAFMGDTKEKGAILPPGDYDIKLSIEQEGDETYVKIILPQ